MTVSSELLVSLQWVLKDEPGRHLNRPDNAFYRLVT